MSDNDCILFIDEQLAKFLIAVKRVGINDIDMIAKITGTGKGQAAGLLQRSKAIGAINEKGEMSEMANKCVNALIKKRVEELKQ
jgi:hypothetical protein